MRSLLATNNPAEWGFTSDLFFLVKLACCVNKIKKSLQLQAKRWTQKNKLCPHSSSRAPREMTRLPSHFPWMESWSCRKIVWGKKTTSIGDILRQNLSLLYTISASWKFNTHLYHAIVSIHKKFREKQISKSRKEISIIGPGTLRWFTWIMAHRKIRAIENK